MTSLPSHILFDYGGVLADEGFVAGMYDIAAQNSLDRKEFLNTAERIIYDCGFVIGQCDEKEYWRRIRKETGISGTDAELTAIILSRFRLRPEMLELVKKLRQRGWRPIILSDQTDWLDRLEARDHFFNHFDRVLNSFHTKISKRDPACFTRALAELKIKAAQAMFIDDNPGHCGRAKKQGIKSHLFTDPETLWHTLVKTGLIEARKG